MLWPRRSSLCAEVLLEDDISCWRNISPFSNHDTFCCYVFNEWDGDIVHYYEFFVLEESLRMYCTEYTAVEQSPKKLVIKSTGPGMNNGWRHINRVSKNQARLWQAQQFYSCFHTHCWKRTFMNWFGEGLSCMFTAIPLRCEVQNKEKHLSSQTDFWRAKILAKKFSYLSLKKNVTFRL